MENKRFYIVCKAKAKIYCPAFISPGSLEPCSVESPSFLKRARIPSTQLEKLCKNMLQIKLCLKSLLFYTIIMKRIFCLPV